MSPPPRLRVRTVLLLLLFGGPVPDASANDIIGWPTRFAWIEHMRFQVELSRP